MEFRRLLFFFQAEDGIRDHCVTGVQTCAFPISSRRRHTRSLCDWSSDVCSSDLRLRLKTFPEVITVTTEQGRPESGTDNETLNLAKVLVRLKGHGEWRKGLTKPQLIEQMRATLSEIPGVSFNFAQPIRDSVEESTSGARGQVVLKVFGPDIPQLRSILQQTVDLVKDIDGVVDLGLYRDAPAPQVHVEFDRIAVQARSEEHTSELQSHSDLVCRLLLEKKKIKNDNRLPYHSGEL